MLKNILLLLLIALMAGCSSNHNIPKPQKKPTHYTQPKDANYIYSVGKGKDLTTAKNNAILALRKQLIDDLHQAFSDKNHILHDESASTLIAIRLASERLCNTLSMRSIRIKNSTFNNNQTLILIKLSKKELFTYLSVKSNSKMTTVKEEYKLAQAQKGIKRYIALKPIVALYPELASIIQLKKNLLPSYNAEDEFVFLKNILDAEIALQKNISFYLISDVNSRVFVPNIQSALQKEGFSVSKTPKSDESLMLMITSKTDNTSDYQFLKSKSLVKFNTFDLKKNPIAFKQRTFIGISKKSYEEAKEQSVINSNGTIYQLGIFDFLGLQ